MSYNFNYGTTGSQPMPAWASILYLAICILLIVAVWKIYVKAGKPGWASIVPFYSSYKLFEIAGMNGWMFLLLLVPIVNIIMYFKVNIDLAHKFGKGTGFGIGLVFLSPIFYCILGFGDAKYQG